MLLQDAVKFRKARYWIRLQVQTQLVYSALLQHCKRLEQHCKQFQKAKLRGHPVLTNLSAATSTVSSVHQHTITTTHNTIQWTQCRFNHPQGNCPASGKGCYNCHRTGHFTALCRGPRNRHRESRSCQRRSSSHRCSSHSHSSSRQSHQRSNSHSPSATYRSPHHTNRYKRSPTPICHQVSHKTFSTQSGQEGRLPTDVASDGHTSFHITPPNDNYTW